MIRMFAVIRAATAAAAWLAGVPVLLLALGGSPLPDHLPSGTQVQAWLDDPLLPAYVPGTARVVAWLIWALLAALILTAWVVQASRWRWERLGAYLPGPVQGLAATLLGAATVTTAVGVPPAHAAAPATTGDTAPPEHPPTTSTVALTATRTAAGQGQNPATSPTITVHRGDTLWGIAGERLGDPHRWKQIYQLNTTHHRSMRGGGHIEPGWTLTLPGSAVPGHHPPRPTTTKPTHPPAGTTPATPAGCPTPPVPETAIPGTAIPGTAVPAASTGTPTPAPPGERGVTATGQGRDTDRPRQPASGISLPGGSWIDLGLAGAITAAAALIWTRRRRHHRGRPLSADLRLDDPDLARMPPVVDQIRRLLRRAANPGTDPHGAATEGFLRTGPAPADDVVDATDPGARPDPGDSHEPGDERGDQTRVRPDDITGDPAEPESVTTDFSSPPHPVVPALAHLLNAHWPPAGLGLVGPGAHSAARGLLTAALATGGVEAPDERSRVVMPADVVVTLLGGTTAGVHTPRLTVTGGLDEALDLLETDILYRSRLLGAHEVDTVTELRTTDPTEEPLPPIMLLADPGTREQRTRIAALLTQGRRLDIHGVLLATWPAGTTIEVTADGTTTPAHDDGSHGAHPADVGRLTVLTAAETRDLLRTLTEAHTGQRPSATATEPGEHNTGDTDTARHTVTTPGEHGEPAVARSAPVSPASFSPTRATPGGDRLIDDPGQDLQGPAAGTSAHRADAGPHPETTATGQHSSLNSMSGAYCIRPDDQGTAGRPAAADTQDVTADVEVPGRAHAQITVLGPVGILGLPTGITPRKKSLELLVYLAVHDGDATAEAILDDVLGDVPASKAPGRLYTYVSDLRAVLRRTAGPGTYISHPAQRYVLNRDLLDVDLWRMQAAIRDATLATDPGEREAALRQAVHTYNGLLADGADYEWIEPYREAVRHQGLDAYQALADLLADNPGEQITVLDAAIWHNPYAEQLYQQAMRTRAELGHLDAIRTLRRALTRALDEIDAEPTDETLTLADHLITRLHRGGTPRRGKHPDPATE